MRIYVHSIQIGKQQRLRRALINAYDNACQAMLDDSRISEEILSRIFEPLFSTK